ncbi:MAG: hypothetical protein ACRDVE_02510 [Actinocrinis sp.]
MSKQSGLGARLFVGGYDLSGDISAVDTIGGMAALLDVTDITQSAHSRITGLRDGSMSFTSFWDTANSVPVLNALPRTDVIASFFAPPLAAGTAPTVACVNAKQVDYDPTRAADGALTMKTACQGQGFGLEWCMPLTAGLRTDTAATDGPDLDCGAGFTTPSVPASGTAAANASPLPATVVVTGGTVSNVVVNGVSVGTGDGTYTVPAGQSITLTYSAAPTWTWALGSAWGAQGYLQVTGFAGTSVTVTVEHSADNSAWATLLSFAAVTAAPNAQRVVVANTTTVDRYLRVSTSGTFSSATFAVALARNPVAGVSF